jgi:hypothetical protein
MDKDSMHLPTRPLERSTGDCKSRRTITSPTDDDSCSAITAIDDEQPNTFKLQKEHQDKRGTKSEEPDIPSETNATTHQSTKVPKHQSTKAPKHQNTKTTKHRFEIPF